MRWRCRAATCMRRPFHRRRAGSTPIGLPNGTAAVWCASARGWTLPVYCAGGVGQRPVCGGPFHHGGRDNANHIAKWNGSSWSRLGSGMNNYCVGAGGVGQRPVCGGQFHDGGRHHAPTYIAKWDGSAWSALGSGMNSAVQRMAVSGSDLYAGGHFTTAGGVGPITSPNGTAAIGWPSAQG